MAFENLFIRSDRNIGGIKLDAVISESHENVIRTSDNHIELGADITDNAVIEPKVLTIVAEVTDTPLGTAALSQIVDSVTGLFGSSTENNITRSSAAYNSLIALMEEKELLEVQTKLKLYQNMRIVSIITTQDKNSSNSVFMNIKLKEALITESELVDIPQDQLTDEITNQQASSAEERGKQEVKTVDEATKKSKLKTITDWVSK